MNPLREVKALLAALFCSLVMRGVVYKGALWDVGVSGLV